jgi:thioester reductase-like protein
MSADFTLPIPRQVKVAVLGTWAVGKTALLTRYTQQRFEDDYKPSKSDTFSFDVTVAGEEIHLGVWDTAGRSKQGADDTRLVLPQTDVGIVCFALTRPHSVIMARRFAAMLREVAGPKTPIVFAGCESDLVQFCNAETTKWSTPAIDLKALRASGGLSAARDLTDVVDDDLSLAPAVVTQEDIDELLAEFGPDHVTYRACSAATGDGVDDLMRQVIMRGLIRAKQRERELEFADAAPPDAAAAAAPVDESAFDAATSDTTDDEAVDLSVSMPDVSRGRDLCADAPKRKIATSFDVSDAGVLGTVMADSMIESLKRFGDAVKNNKATVTPAPPPLVADPRDQTALALLYLFSTADCFHCKRRIEFGELRHHCFEDECPQRVDICSPCLKQHGHVHRTFAERVWLPADMSWRLSGRSAVHTFLNCMHFFSARPAVGRPVHDSGGRCVRYEWLTYGELFQRSCLLVVALRCPPTDHDDDTSSDDDDDDDDDGDDKEADSDPLDLSAIHESLRARELAARITPAQRLELAALLAPGAFVGLLSENRRQFYSVDLGCQLCGLVTVPIHTAYNTATMAHVLDDSGVVALFCTHTQLAAAVGAARVARQCKVRFFVVIDDDDVSDGAARAALVAANGVASVLLLSELTAALDARLAYGRFYENWKARDLFALSYTSGSTGTPKGVMECAEHFQQKPSANTVSYRMRGSSCFVSWEPLAHSQRSNDWNHLAYGGRVGVYDGPMGNAFFDHLRVLQPTSFSSVPRLFNVVYADYRAALAERLIAASARQWPRLPPSFACDVCGQGIVDARWSCRLCNWDACEPCVQSARARRDLEQSQCAGGHKPTHEPAPRWLDSEHEQKLAGKLAADFVRGVPPNVVAALFSVDGSAASDALAALPTWKSMGIAEQLLAEMRGFFGGKLLSITTGGAPTAPAVMDFLRAVFTDARITNSYGITEVGGITWDQQITTTPGVVLKLIDVPELGYRSTDKPWPRGEILVRHPSMALGYFNDAERTAAAWDADGFFHTGDVGEQRSDGLYVIDRCKNIIKLAQGEFVSPPMLEGAFIVSSLVRAIFVHGDSLRSTLVAVVIPDGAAALRVLRELAPADADVRAALDASEHAALDAAADADAELCAVVGRAPAARAALTRAVVQSLARVGVQQALPSYAIPRHVHVAVGDVWAETSGMTASGKIDRQALRARYATQIAALWTAVDAMCADELKRADSAVRDALGDIGGGGGGGGDDDALDIDSLSAVRLVSKLRKDLAVDISLRDVLAPGVTVGSLRSAVSRAAGDALRSSSVQKSSVDIAAESAIDLDAELPATRDQLTASSRQLWPIDVGVRNVLLTGVTGHVGAHLLHALQRQFPRATVWCLIRPRGGLRRSAADPPAPADATASLAEPPAGSLFADYESDADDAHRLAKRRLGETINFFGLSVDATRARALAGDLALPRFGVTAEQWHWLAHEVDCVVHNGAVVNAVLPYESLRDANVGGTRTAIALCGTVVAKPLVFVSTLSILDNDPSRAEDAALPAWLGATLDGYSLSKFIAELLVRAAAVRIPALVARLGTVFASTQTGAANPRAFIDRLLGGAMRAGVFPDTPQTRVPLSAIPVDRCAAAIARAMAYGAMRGQTLHLTGVPAERDALTYEAAFRALPGVTALPFEEWRGRVLDDVDNPLAALRHYFSRGFPAAESRTSTTHTAALLQAMDAGDLLRAPTVADVERAARFYARTISKMEN